MSRRLNADWAVEPAEHTVHGRTYDVVEWWPEEGSTGAIVARLHPSVRGVQGKEESLPLVRERALVMAASRELLAACREAAAGPLDHDDLQSFHARIKATCEAAIKKARGQ